MLEDDPHLAYREFLRRKALAIVPDIAKKDAKIASLLKRVRRSLRTRASYPTLAQDLQFARNPALVSTHPNKTRARLRRSVEQTTKAAALATADALAKNLVADQARLELDLFDDAEPLAEDIPKSRENPGEDGYNLRYLRRFIGQLSIHEVSRSAVQIAPSFALSGAAQIIGWSTRDTDFDDPQNPVPHLYQSGFFDFWNAELTEQEALLIDRAAALDHKRVMAEVRRVFGAELPLDYPISSAMLMGMARIADPESPLARINWDTVQTANTMVASNEVAFVQKTLGLGDKNRGAAEQVVSFLKHRVENEAIQNFEQSVPFDLIRIMIDELDPAGSEVSDWMPRFLQKIQLLAEQLAPIVRSEEVFFAIMHAAFQHSLAKVKFDEMDGVKRANSTYKRNMESLDEALASGLSFKFRSDGMAIVEDHPDYHLIAQQPMTRETYMATSAGPLDLGTVAPSESPREEDAKLSAKNNAPAQNDMTVPDIVDHAAIPWDANYTEKSLHLAESEAREDAEKIAPVDIPRDTPGEHRDHQNDPPSKQADATIIDAQPAPPAKVSSNSTQVAVLPPFHTKDRGQSRQKSLFDVDDKDVI
jgi:hypothetical protein